MHSSSRPDSVLLAGGTDIGLGSRSSCANCRRWSISATCRSSRVSRNGAHELWIGAAVTLTDAWPALLARFPELEEQAARFASPPIRNSATLCGNLANGSPIGDSIPALIALDAQTRIAPRRAAAQRAARGFLSRVPEEGSGRRASSSRGSPFRAAHGRTVAGELQALEAHRPGYFRGQRDLLRERRGRPRAERPSRLWRLGRHRLPRAPCGARARRRRLDSRGNRGRRRRARRPTSNRSSDLRATRRLSSARPPAICCAAFFWQQQPTDTSHCARPMPCWTWTERHAIRYLADPRQRAAARQRQAQYCDDIALPANTLHAAFGLSPIAHGRIRVARSVRGARRRPAWPSIALPADIPGENNYGGAVHDDPIFAEQDWCNMPGSRCSPSPPTRCAPRARRPAARSST